MKAGLSQKKPKKPRPVNISNRSLKKRIKSRYLHFQVTYSPFLYILNASGYNPYSKPLNSSILHASLLPLESSRVISFFFFSVHAIQEQDGYPPFPES